MTGKIVRLMKDKGFGFIKNTAGVEFFFHASALKNVSFDDLEVQDEVTFEDSESNKGPRAEDIYR